MRMNNLTVTPGSEGEITGSNLNLYFRERSQRRRLCSKGPRQSVEFFGEPAHRERCGRIGFCKRWASNTSGGRSGREPARHRPTNSPVLTRVKRFQYCRKENLRLRKAPPSSHTSGGLTVLNVACYRPPIRKPRPTITNGVFF